MTQLRKAALAIWALLLLLLLPLGGTALASSSGNAEASSSKEGAVFILPVDQEIERGLEKFLKRGFEEAERYGASLIVLEIDTPGGLVSAAEDIGTMVRESQIPTLAFINGDAASAGSYIALNANKIVMKPGSMIGSASLVDGSGNKIEDAKLVSFWKSKMAGAAALNGRDPDIAAGMTDANLAFDKPDLGVHKTKGEIIALTSEQALKAGYADAVKDSPEAAAEWMGYKTNDVFRVEHTGAEKMSEFLTHPVVMTILLFVGIAGVVIELMVPGFGVPGILGTIAFVLYFFGNYVAGFAGSEVWLLFILGLVMMVLELFVPSFGILGVLGSISLVAGVVRAAYSFTHALFSLGIAFGAAIVVIILVGVAFKERGIWNRFILSDSLSKERGFVPVREKLELMGMPGISLTPLRPAGTAMIADERVDVVTEGGFIGINRPISVVKVEGSRIVVKEAGE
ncbi:nodulation protein NfeD [Paenibacillus sp. HN-1]|uniref:NfeD family protein n=1 Tax=Paenibacillus TaxID=44249 RepID=UPI001CA7E4A0|nr:MULTISPECIES: NfeD family protein [Paenibacillus]MBY9079434.1 nodulation protein NfeD [Paenibacillus sp. CGMCC 1.18879]MBY9083415.1 nodulation protein NfeD [Paenibacillus sinensis]